MIGKNNFDIDSKRQINENLLIDHFHQLLTSWCQSLSILADESNFRPENNWEIPRKITEKIERNITFEFN